MVWLEFVVFFQFLILFEEGHWVVCWVATCHLITFERSKFDFGIVKRHFWVFGSLFSVFPQRCSFNFLSAVNFTIGSPKSLFLRFSALKFKFGLWNHFLGVVFGVQFDQFGTSNQLFLFIKAEISTKKIEFVTPTAENTAVTSFETQKAQFFLLPILKAGFESMNFKLIEG